MSGTKPSGRIAAAVLIGTTLEFYDFFIYGTAAALVFGRAFFPSLTPVNGLLAAFSVYAVGFLGRPTGAAVFGHLGDRLGRKRVLVGSLLLMGLSTTAVGLLPGYAHWGVWSPIALTVLRFLQGVGLGGEFGGAALLAVEHAEEGRRGRLAGFVQLGPSIGFALATGLFWLLSALLPEAGFQAWGWRLPFLASMVLVGFGLVVRSRVQETPAFLAADTGGAPATPLKELAAGHLRPLLLGAGTVMSGSVLFYTATTWCLARATADLHLPRTRMLGLLLIANVFLAAATYASARLSDRWGRRRMILVGTFVGLLWSPMLVPLLDTARTPLMFTGLTGALVALGLCLGPVPALLSELFPTAVRCSGASLSYNLGGLVGGAVAPLIATRIAATFGGPAVGAYLAAVCAISTLSAAALPETSGRALTEPVPEPA
ncbi:MFS transporter [Streptacidiphilus carbonis]|uniref:MFS transporter n=1 Tax=Streptacidiphilus carbonis TaxID=105422 RepID=UPI0005A71D0E|nr:MFS transporter [Streptacidiphilus carbonis]